MYAGWVSPVINSAGLIHTEHSPIVHMINMSINELLEFTGLM